MTLERGERIDLRREVAAIAIPQGSEERLPAGVEATVVQTLGGHVTVSVGPPHGPPGGQLYRIEERDTDALGLEPASREPARGGRALPLAPVTEEQVRDVLRTIYDPEIPVNVVELGLIYRVELVPAPGGERVEVDMTLTAPGCGMADVLRRDVEQKLAALPGVAEAAVQVVFDPPWTRDRMSEGARLALGLL